MTVKKNTINLWFLDAAGFEVRYFEFTSLALLFGAAANMMLVTEYSIKNMEMSLLKRSVTGRERDVVKRNAKKLIKKYNVISQYQLKFAQEYANPCFGVFSKLLLPVNTAQFFPLNRQCTIYMDEEIKNLKLRYKRALCRVALFSIELYEAKRLHVTEKQLFLLQKVIGSIKDNICDRKIAYKCIVQALNRSTCLEPLFYYI